MTPPDAGPARDAASGTLNVPSTTVTTTHLAKRPMMQCKTCGAKDTTDSPWSEQGRIPRISVFVEGYEGDYCQVCYAQWLSQNIPKLVPLRVPPSEGPTR